MKSKAIAVGIGLLLAVVGTGVACADSSVTLAVLPFHQASSESADVPWAESISDLVQVRLAAVEGLKLVDRSALAKVMQEQQLSNSWTPTDQIRIGKIVGARYMLAGDVLAAGEAIQVDVHLLEVETARVVKSAKATAQSNQLVEALDPLVRQLTDKLNLKLPELTTDQIDQSPEANLHFMRGLGYYHAQLYDDALVEFMKALAIDPNHARARFWNGMAYFSQNEYAHARLEFSRFLKQAEKNELASRAKELLEQCEKQTEKPQGESR